VPLPVHAPAGSKGKSSAVDPAIVVMLSL